MNIKFRLKILIITTVVSLYGCDFTSNQSDQQITKPSSKQEIEQTREKDNAPKEQLAITIRNKKQSPIKMIKIWNRLRNNFCLNLARDNSYVRFHAEKYKSQEQYLQQVTNNASPYISHIMEQLEKRKMPGELALLPMIESSFNPDAISEKGATGIWQLGAKTGKRYGLKQNGWYDDRTNVTAATNAALSYLQFLHQEFDGDWFLALAAYNAGEGRVRRAINRNLAENKPTDFWSLNLPQQTKNFVPKLLALASLIKHADIKDMATFKFKNIPYFAMLNIADIYGVYLSADG